jgi:hypothetical protein
VTNQVLVRTGSALGLAAAGRLARGGHRVAVVEPADDLEIAMAAAVDRLGGPVDRYIDCTPIDFAGGGDGDWAPAVRCVEEMLLAGSFAIRQMIGAGGRCLVVLAPHWVARPDAVDVATVMGAAAATVLGWATDLRGSTVRAFGLVVEEPRPADHELAVVVDRLQAAGEDLNGQLLYLAEDELRAVDSQLMTPPWVSRPTWTSQQVADAVAGPLAGRLVEPHYAGRVG